ncbi:MAG: histidine phosphatase family protein, partial [Ktedonobacterales bacterium]
ASTLPRARQTAEILAPAIGKTIIWDDDVQELNVGAIDGVPWRDIAATVPDFRVEPFRPIAPGGENWPRFVLRVATAFERIIRENDGKTIVVVCHGGVIDSSFAIFYGMSAFAFPAVDLATRNTSITHWERHAPKDPPGHGDRTPPDGLSTRWRLVGYNDDTHVRDIGAEERIRWPRATPEATGGVEAPAVPLPTEDAE